MLSKILLKLGFNEKEARIYLCLLQRGSLVSSTISKHTKLNRSTCYSILERLHKKRIIQQYVKNNIKYYKANPPQQINYLLQLEEESLHKKQRLFKEMLPLLDKVINQNTNLDPKIKLYQGLDGIKQSYEDSLFENDTIYSIKNLNRCPSQLKKYLLQEYIPRRIRKKIQAKVITNQSLESRKFQEQDKFQYRKTKIIPKEIFNFPVEINLYKDKASFIIFSQNKYLSLIIESQEINESLKMLFNLLWLQY